MLRLLVVLLVITVVSEACDKDKFQTKPTLTLKSKNGDIIPSVSALVLDFEFTDKEGDIDDTLYVKKIRINTIKVPTIRDSFALPVPTFPKHTQGEVRVTLDHGFYLISAINPPKDPVTGKNMNDTLMLKFALKDRFRNISDTVTVGPIIVLRN